VRFTRSNFPLFECNKTLLLFVQPINFGSVSLLRNIQIKEFQRPKRTIQGRRDNPLKREGDERPTHILDGRGAWEPLLVRHWNSFLFISIKKGQKRKTKL